MNENDIRPLSWSEAPKRGENMLGYVTRMFAENVHPWTGQALGLAGLETSYPEGIAEADEASCRRLALLFRQEETTIAALSIRSAEEDGFLPVMIDFHGVPIRRSHKEAKIRRVSPTTLRTEPWHHAVWDIRTFGFCPISMEVLLSSCPVCGKDLGWKRSRGPTFCQSCVDDRERPIVDLRDFPQARIDCDDFEALSFVTSLVCPVPEARADNRRVLPPCLHDVPDGDLYDLAILLANCLKRGGDHRGVVPVGRLSGDPGSAPSPEHLATAGRAIINWPTGFDTVAQRVRDGRHFRKGFYGKKHELGPLIYAAESSSTLTPTARSLLRSALDANLASVDEAGLGLLRRAPERTDTNLITKTEAGRLFHVAGSCLRRLADRGHIYRLRAGGAKGPSLYRRTDIEGIVAARAEAVALHTVASTLGLSEQDVRRLVTLGLLRPFTHPAVMTLRRGAYYEKSSLAQLLSDVESRLRPIPDGAPTSKYARMAGVSNLHDRCRADLLKDIVDGCREAFRITGEAKSLAASIVVQRTIADPNLPALDLKHAIAFLGIGRDAVACCRWNGLLGSKPDQKIFSEAELTEFKERYVLTGEIAKRMDWGPADVSTRLAHLEIHPLRTIIRPTSQAKLRLYCRRTVEKHLLGEEVRTRSA